jgi:hypothetical protein
MVKEPKGYNIIPRDTTSRKGNYHYQQYKDNSGTIKSVEIRTDRMTKEQFNIYFNNVQGLSSRKEKGVLRNNIISGTFKVGGGTPIKKPPIETPPEPPKKDYKRELEQSRNALINDRVHKKKLSVYESEELIIILRVDTMSSLSDMSESTFERKLRNYVGVNGGPRGNQALFLNDIINKWGVEFKK